MTVMMMAITPSLNASIRPLRIVSRIARWGAWRRSTRGRGSERPRMNARQDTPPRPPWPRHASVLQSDAAARDSLAAAPERDLNPSAAGRKDSTDALGTLLDRRRPAHAVRARGGPVRPHARLRAGPHGDGRAAGARGA